MNDKKELTIIELTEENIEAMVYEIRGQKVMLDFDLARIYGYTTKAFNQQVQRNIEKFPEDFMFQLTNEELERFLRCKIITTNTNLRSKKSATNDNLRSQIVTANELSSKRRYNPYAFTEQGIYMLMTVLKGELAVKQSKALIRLFKRMKDYIVENTLLDNNASLINNKFVSYDKRFEIMESKLNIVMDNFIDPSTYKHFLILNGQKIEADIAYQSIYKLAKCKIYIIDNYIDIKTLKHLKANPQVVEVIIFTDNLGTNKLSQLFIIDFIKDTGIRVLIKELKRQFHDRYIVLDYLSTNEKIFHCGASSKDAGKSVTTIMEIEQKELYHPLIDSLLQNNIKEV